jgi:hypothetical protein
VTAYSDEPNSREQSKMTSQNIDVEYSTVSRNPDFTSSGLCLLKNVFDVQIRLQTIAI